jgi:NAD(P)-dependent dehydrogenase (short-subunit alcohol dehydrogenase family)
MKKILLTGASAGIGRLAALKLCERGHEVWGTGRTLAKLPVHPKFHPVLLDLNDVASIESGFQQALSEAQYFDVLINNAGSGVFGPLESFSDAEFNGVLETLLLGPVRLIRLALPHMRARNQGIIVNISSLGGEFPLPFMAPYSMCKAAVSAMSEGLTLELAHTGIRVIDVRPGDFKTDFHEATRRIGADLGAAYAPNLEKAWTAIDKNMRQAQDPVKVAELLLNIVEGRARSGVIAVGDVFQARIAPFLTRFARRTWVVWCIQAYYGLKRGR